MAKKVILSEEERIVIIKFNKPDKLNALDEEMWVDLAEILETYREDKMAIITGEGKAFSAGDDIKMMYEFKGLDESEYFVTTILKRAIRAFLDYRLPIFSAVNGYAVGGGCEITLLTDMVIASPNAVFGVPEIKIGLLPPVMLSLGGHMIGFKKAFELSLSGRFLTAEEAREIGLVDVIDDDPVGKAVEYAEELWSIPKETLYSYKDYVNSVKLKMLDDALADKLALLMINSEAKKLMEKFLKKEL